MKLILKSILLGLPVLVLGLLLFYGLIKLLSTFPIFGAIFFGILLFGAVLGFAYVLGMLILTKGGNVRAK